MKKSAIFFGKILSVGFVIGLSSCGDNKSVPQENEIEVVPPAQIIQIPEAKESYDTYEKRRVTLIQKYEDSINRSRENLKAINEKNSKAFDVGRFVYYDYETIKQYLAYIEQEAKKANVEISTLRFYFSNYPDETFFPGTKDSIKHPRQNSILISPTYNDGKRDFLFYIAQGAEGAEAVPLNDSFGAIKGYGINEDKPTKSYAAIIPNLSSSTVLPSSSLQGSTSLTLNRGTGVPPPKDQ
ncbi:hypothetical protein [Maribacter aestuarii]|uniref:hypothetical protein n=1 Tax=Maribacter aestuarii TaxID=1130723 RepID=UPI00248BC4E6|nr:hypothetical protein [Maribacter aestuarii]